MRTVAIIQARLGSNRLPLKSLLSLRGVPIIDWVVQRVSKATLVDAVVVATPDTAVDAVLGEHLQRQGVQVFAGAENDVLARFYHAARAFAAERIVRVCADNPLIWGCAIDALLRYQHESGMAYAYNHIPRGNLWPDGLGAEVVSFATLETLYNNAQLPQHREHCLSYIWDNAAQWSIGTFDPDNPRLQHPECKLDIDTVEDYCRMARMPITPDMDEDALIHLLEKDYVA